MQDAEVDFIAPHRPRDAGSPKQTAAKTRDYLAAMRDLGRVVPVHFQEPFRRGYDAGWQPSADDKVGLGEFALAMHSRQANR